MKWDKVPLSALCANPDDIRCGPFGTQLNKDEFREEGIPLWGIKQVNVGFSIQTKEFLEPKTAMRLSQYNLIPGDLVMTRKGTVGNCAVYPSDFEPGIMHSDLLRMRVDPERCDSSFLVYQLHYSQDVARQLSLISGGAIMPGINVGRLKQLEVIVPPLAEQKRIAGILDAADALRGKRREALVQLDSLLQSTFLDLFGDPGGPPVTIGLPKHNGAKKFTLLTEVARLATGHTPDRKKPEYWGGNIPWIGLTDIRDLDGQIATTTSQFITEKGLQKSSAVKLPKGTVCFSRTASVGFSTIMGTDMATSQDFVNWVCGPNIKPVYLMWAFIRSRVSLISQSTGSTHKTIYFPSAKKFHVHLPPISLQRRFAAIVESVERQKARQRAHLAELDALFASLQHRAFRGEL